MNPKLKQSLIACLSSIRAPIMRVIRPKDAYFLAIRSLQPISTKCGFDRYYIEAFLEGQKNVIKGYSLEVVTNTYTMAWKDLTKEELDYNDPHFPCIITITAQK